MNVTRSAAPWYISDRADIQHHAQGPIQSVILTFHFNSFIRGVESVRVGMLEYQV